MPLVSFDGLSLNLEKDVGVYFSIDEEPGFLYTLLSSEIKWVRVGLVLPGPILGG